MTNSCHTTMKLQQLVWFLVARLVTGTPLKTSRIVGGKSIAIDDAPFTVALEISGQVLCGGSIISNNIIITAAHCTFRKKANEFTIHAGSSYRQTGGRLYAVKKIYQHPNFDMESTDYDVSIMQIRPPIKFSKSAAPIALARANDIVSPGTFAYVYGWGIVKPGSPFLADRLRGTQLKIVDKETCEKQYGQGRITERMLCAGTETGGRDTCQGDSGGPLVVDDVLVGITSWGSGCGDKEFAGVYSDVAALRGFIDEVLEFL